jgi:hypothetical protein
MSSTEFDTTRTPRARFAPLISAMRIIAASLALAAVGAAVAVFVSQAGRPHATAVVLVDSAGPDTTVQVVPQTITETVTPRPASCPTKLRLCEPVYN